MAEVVVVSPHPDDDAIGMGGTMAKMAGEGISVASIYLTDGRRSPRSFRMSDEEMARARRAEAEEAARELGLSEAAFLGFPDLGPSGSLRRREALRALSAELRRLRPRAVYVTHPAEAHRTHAEAAKLALDAARMAGLRGFELWGYEVWTPIQRPTLFVDITDYIGAKLRAIRCHRTQLFDKAYDEGILGLNRYRAVFFEMDRPDRAKYMEAFVRLR